MIIRFTKPNTSDKLATVHCVRRDGTEACWPLTPFFEVHDLAHYVVEMALGTDNAFFGLVRKGWDLDAFLKKRTDRRELSCTALQVEELVGLLQLAVNGAGISNDQIQAILFERSIAQGLPILPLSNTDLDSMKEKLTKLMAQWEALAPGESMTLRFAPEREFVAA